MSKLTSYFAPQALAYPGACAPGAAGGSRGEGILERFFAPAELPYPIGSTQLEPRPLPPSSESVRIVRVTVENPAVSASIGEERLDEIAEFIDVAHAVEVNGAPIVVTVPEGFDKVELCFGSIVGAESDALIALGEPRFREAAVVPGRTITVIVPWKFAPWISVPGGRLMVDLVAIFTKTAA